MTPDERIAQLEAHVDALYRALNLNPPYSPQQAQPEWLLQARELKAAGRPIQAIKLYRERTGLGLKEAKDAVDAL